MTTRNTGYRVRRAFRGSVLWLTSFTTRPLSFQWSTAGKPQEFETSAAALAAADKAAREYGAVCAVVDPAGNLLQPASAILKRAEPRVYATTYCNHGHYVKTGKPVNHECRTIPPAALRAEMDGNFELAISIMRGDAS